MTDSILSCLGELDGRHEGLAGVDIGLFSEVASIVEIAEKQGFSSAQTFIKDSLFSKIRTLTNGILRARFMKEAGRSVMRSFKNATVLSSRDFYLESCLSWNSIPSDFSSYIGGVPEPCGVSEEAAFALEDIGCTSLALSLRSRRPAVEKESGFPRLSIKRASMILAKNSGYEPVRKGRECVLQRQDSDVFRSLVLPLHFVGDLVSSRLSDVLRSCDSDGIFDHHVVVAPILGHSDGTVEDLRKSLVSGMVNPVVLGEREGICYFVGFVF